MRRGSLADVSLERHFTPPPLPFSKTRRSSRVDNVELDILNTGRRPSRDIILDTLNNIPHTRTPRKSGQDSVNLSPVQDSVTNNTSVGETHVIKQRGSGPEKNNLSRQTYVEVNREGQKPSLADLVAVYENFQNEE